MSKELSLQVSGQTVHVQTEVSGQSVRWERKTIEVNEPVHHLDIEDTFTNLTDEIVGLKINHSVSHEFAETWLGGQKFLSVKDLSPKKSPVDFSDSWNPSIYTQVSAGEGLGLISRDDVLRQQTRVYYDPFSHRSGLRTETFCLGPKSRTTTSWSVYQTHGTYWDFINSVREVWGVNHPIGGSFMWFQPDDILAMDFNFLKARLRFQNVNTASMFGGWVDPKEKHLPGEKPMIGFGTSVLSPRFENLRARLRMAITKLKAAQPAIKVLMYFDAQRESLPETEELFNDSLFRTEDAKLESTDWGGRYLKTWSVYPTLKNKFGRKLEDVVALSKKIGADGLYWDEMESLDYSGVRQTSDEWDGHSCRLGEKEKVLAKIGFTNLLSEDVKERYATQAGFVLANSPPTTMFFSRRADLHMVENQHLTDYSSYAHLTTPLAYIGSGSDWEHIVGAVDRGLLPTGVRLDYTTEFFAKIYPITVDRIYPGAIFGEDKIVVSKNGTYGWREDCSSLKLSQFDSVGHSVEPTVKRPAADLSCVVETYFADRGALVMERRRAQTDSAIPLAQRPKKTPVFFYPAVH